MIKFFRKIRQKMLTENKFSKYLLYAIGEIILVVIGILIALQINNWNENKTERKFEKRMLTELKVALDNDLKTIENYEKIAKSWQKSNIYLVKAMLEKEKATLDKDSVVYHLDYIYGLGLAFIYNNGPYEALKSSGLDKIEDDELRQEISQLYSFDLTSTDMWVNQIIREEIAEKFELFEQLFNLKISFKDGKIIKELNIENLDFLDSPLFSDIINKSNNITKSTIPSYRAAIKKMSALRDMINQRIE
jgi:hypothetical protein